MHTPETSEISLMWRKGDGTLIHSGGRQPIRTAVSPDNDEGRTGWIPGDLYLAGLATEMLKEILDGCGRRAIEIHTILANIIGATLTKNDNDNIPQAKIEIAVTLEEPSRIHDFEEAVAEAQKSHHMLDVLHCPVKVLLHVNEPHQEA